MKEEGFAISIVRDGKTIFQSALPGISALVAAIDKNRFDFRGATVGDRVLGRAAAMLYLYSGISSVFASTASSDATAILSKFGVPFEYETKVPMILNRQRTAMCPFESLVQDVETPEEAFEKLKALALKRK